MCKGKEDIERKNSLLTGSSDTISASGSSPSLYRRLAQTEADTELIAGGVTESDIQASMFETQMSAQELQEKAKVRSDIFFSSVEIEHEMM